MNPLAEAPDGAVESSPERMRQLFSVLEEDGRAILLSPSTRCAEAMRQQMTDAGFEVEAMLPFNRASRPLLWFNKSVLRRKTVGRFQLWAFDQLVWIFRAIDNQLPWLPSSVIVIGRKIQAMHGSTRTGKASVFNAGVRQETGPLQAVARIGQVRGV
jgi:hypothetical protein